MPLLRQDLSELLIDFRDRRDWRQFHTPRNLAVSVVIEAGELLECFQWVRDAEIADVVECKREMIEDEVADLAILLNYLCSDIGIDVDAAVERKLRKNEAKYPVELSRGRSEKYDAL